MPRAFRGARARAPRNRAPRARAPRHPVRRRRAPARTPRRGRRVTDAVDKYSGCASAVNGGGGMGSRGAEELGIANDATGTTSWSEARLSLPVQALPRATLPTRIIILPATIPGEMPFHTVSEGIEEKGYGTKGGSACLGRDCAFGTCLSRAPAPYPWSLVCSSPVNLFPASHRSRASL